MKIVLLNPPITYPKRFYSKSSVRVNIPIGLLYIAAVLEKKGYDVKILDALTLTNKLITETNDMFYLGASWDKIKEEIEKLSPDVVGITNQYSSQINNAIKSAEIIRQVNKNIKIIVGGPHASIKPEDFFPHADFVIMGEGEYATLDLLEYFKGKKKLKDIKGLAYKNNKKLIINEKCPIKELDKLPLPAYHLINLEKYFEIFKGGHKSRPHIKSNRFISMITSRGCPYNCIFCSNYLHMGKFWRGNSAEYVINHITHLKDNYKVEHLIFEDDNLLLDKERIAKISEAIGKLGLTWHTSSGVRADKLDDELLENFKKNGCTRLVISIESGSQRVLDEVIDKKLDLKPIPNITKKCKELGIDLHSYYIIGLPGETKKEILQTLDYAFMLMKKYNVIPAIGIAEPLINTRLYKICKEKGYLVRDLTKEELAYTFRITRPGLIKTEEFNPVFLRNELKRFYRKVAIYQFLKPGYIIKKLFENPKIFIGKVKELINRSFMGED